MEAFADVAPAHNPPYIKAMRMLGERFPGLPLVAAFETGFHRTIPEANQRYAIPDEWATEHGDPPLGLPRGQPSLHRRPDGRIAGPRRPEAHLVPPRRVSPRSAPAGTAESVATTMGMSPQTGLPQNNRVGDFDVFALPAAAQGRPASRSARCSTPWPTARAWSGSAGPAATSATSRPPPRPATSGRNLALDVSSARSATTSGAYLVELGGADAVVFTGGIGENSTRIRERRLPRPRVVRDRARPARNAAGRGRAGRLGRGFARRSSGPCRPTRRSWSPARSATSSPPRILEPRPLFARSPARCSSPE